MSFKNEKTEYTPPSTARQSIAERQAQQMLDVDPPIRNQRRDVYIDRSKGTKRRV